MLADSEDRMLMSSRYLEMLEVWQKRRKGICKDDLGLYISGIRGI